MYYFMRYLVQLFFHLKYRMKIWNKENAPKLKGGYIIACNHQKYADPPMIASVIHAKFSFMAKDELFHKNKFFKWLIIKCGAFPVVRGAGDGEAVRLAVEKLNQGRVLVIFPEGTRSYDGVIQRGKSGVALIASMTGAPVLPMYIRYGEKRIADVAIGEMIPAEEMKIDSEDHKALKRVSNRIMDSIKALQKQVCDGRGIPVPLKVRKSTKAEIAENAESADSTETDNG